MSQKRVLVVDDLPDLRRTICALLMDDGYFVRSVATRDDALQLLEEERFHVAVLDVRLDDSDEGNQEGLQLMHDIAQKYPATISIILTGFADVKMVQEALRPNTEGISPAFSFLQKTEISKLPEWVEKAFKDRIKIESDLIIEDLDSSIPYLASHLRLKVLRRPSAEELQEEIKEVFAQLFFDCKKIQISNMQQGFSGAVVCRVKPFYAGSRDEGLLVVVKIGNQMEIEVEDGKHKKIVQGIVGGNRFPVSLKLTKTKSLGGILYPFVGLGQAEDFADYYRNKSTEQIEILLENLYDQTCFPNRVRTGSVQFAKDLKDFYVPYLRIYQEKLADALHRCVGKKHAFQLGSQNQLIFNGDQMVNPVDFISTFDFRIDSFFSVIHGDLNGHNVLVDRHDEAWLIDFVSTLDCGHILQDYSAMEVFVKMLIIDKINQVDFIEWEKNLFCDVVNAALLDRLINQTDFQKAHSVIKKIRTLASATPYYSKKSYLISLIFNTLRIPTFYYLPANVRERAFLSASVIADEIRKG